MKKNKSYNLLNSQFHKILWVFVAWTLVALLQFLVGYAAIVQLSLELRPAAIETYFWGSLITGLVAGSLGGTLMILLWEPWLRKTSYRKALLKMWWSFTAVFLVVSFINGFFFFSKQLELPFYHIDVLSSALAQPFAITQLNTYFFWLVVVLITIIALLVNDKYGPGIFASFLLGKYFSPKKEERIFMFLDLRGSTTIAEKLGEEKYFNFLKDVFKDATPGILQSQGEIYQYVGDEIVVSWKKQTGAENANAINCFFEVKESLRSRAAYYQENYNGILPDFKAGLHYGSVMAGELGIIKRELAYSGDVLNTTARIQSKCNELGVNILLSKRLLALMKHLPDRFNPREIGDILLKGKEESVVLYTL